MAAYYGPALNTRLFRRAMQLRRNKLVFRASYGQRQFSTMTKGRHNQWAGKQAPDHHPITVLIASKNNGCLHRKNFKTAHLQVQL